MSRLDQLRDQDKGSLRRTIIVVVIVASILLLLFIFTPLIWDSIVGTQQENPSEKLPGSLAIFSLLLALF